MGGSSGASGMRRVNTVAGCGPTRTEQHLCVDQHINLWLTVSDMGEPQLLVEAAIKKFGSEAKLGAACGVSQNAIWNAKKKGRVSDRLAVAIERATAGEIPRWR